MLKSFVIIGIMLIAGISIAENTQQYSKIYLSPFYRETMLGNTNYTYLLNVNSPDGIYEVYSAIISFDVYLNPSRNFTLWVNNKECNTKNYYVSTSYAGAGQHRIMFDCSNVITKEGLYNITLRSSGNNGASNGWLDLTYSNKPIMKLITHGTEYYSGQNGTIFLQVENWDNTICEINIYYPNKTLMTSSIMNYLNNSKGIYYYDFIAPSEEGIYISEALCYLPISSSSITSYYGYNNPLFVTKGQLETISNYYSYGSFGNGAERCNYFFDAPDTYDNLIFSQIGTIYNHRIFLYAGGTRTTQIKARYYKFNEGTNTLTYAGETAGLNYSVTNIPTGYAINSFSSNYSLTTKEKLVTEVCLKNFGGSVEYRFYFGGSTNSSFNRNTTAINKSMAFEYRGTNEIHISNVDYLGIFSGVWNYGNRTLTDYNLSGILNAIESINISINQTFGNISFDINETDISENVWFKFFSLGTPRNAKEVINYACLDNQTSIMNISVNGYSKIEFKECKEGCDFNTGECRLNSYVRIGFIFILFIILVIVVKLMRDIL